MKGVMRCTLVVAVASLLFACQSIGHNESYLLQYKADLRELYAVEERDSPTDPDAKHWYESQRKEFPRQRSLYLTKIYRSNLPLSLTDVYDTRTKKTPIRAGDPLNLIINKIHLKDNRERLPGVNADVAVVVTVDDGKAAEPKHTLVAYETDIGKNVNLPIADLIAYSNESYGDEPVRIEITVFSMYNVKNATYTQILGTAAAIGAASAPTYGPAIAVANQIGKILINSKQNAVIAKFTFQLYPWELTARRFTDQLGVPRVAYGHYLILRADRQEEIGDPESIHLDWAFRLYRVGPSPLTKDAGSLEVLEKELKAKVKDWPIPSKEDSPREPLELTYLVLTVDNTKVSNAQQIINRADAMNRSLAQLAKDAAIIPGQVQLVDEQLDDLKSKVRLQVSTGNFQKLRRSPQALEALFRSYDDPKLKEADRGEVLELIRNYLPTVSDTFLKDHKIAAKDSMTIGTLKSWYEEKKDQLTYDPKVGRYCIGRC